MSSYKDLIDVSFEDRTNYVDFNTGDILGLPFNHYWGPVNKRLLLSRADFLRYFPESMPLNYAFRDVSTFFAYANILNAFSKGITTVEVVRINPSNQWKYNQFNLTAASVMESVQSAEQFSKDAAISFALKYPGYIPQFLAPGCVDVKIKVTIDDSDSVKVEVIGVDTQSNSTTLEEFEGSLDSNATYEGSSIFIEKLLESSEFLSCKVNSTANLAGTAEVSVSSVKEASFTDLTKVEVTDALDKYFSDFQSSRSTLLISPLKSNEVDSSLIKKAKERQDVNAVIGLPISTSLTKEEVENFLKTVDRNMFSFFVAGREMISVFGVKLESNCVAGWCGATANIAKQVRLNQLASARSYGAYSGVLVDTLQFSEVLELHKQGVISVYQSVTGAEIFGVRSLNQRQSSYFGKANVIRVLAALLRNAFPIALESIHTDAASNPSTRADFQIKFQSVVDSLIAGQNLRGESFADCGEDLNTDYLTKGGTIFNVLFECWFIGLVESVKIKIVATDSSVSAEVQQ